MPVTCANLPPGSVGTKATSKRVPLKARECHFHMEDYMVACGDHYKSIAEGKFKNLKLVGTPFMDEQHADPGYEDPQNHGVLQNRA